MQRRAFLRVASSGLTVGTAGLAGCEAPGGGAGTPESTPVDEETPTARTGTTGEPTPRQGGQTDGGDESTVAMVAEGSDYYFDPIGLFVESGKTVIWRNESGSHSSTAYVPDNPQAEVRRIPEGAEGWNSETTTDEGATSTHTFETTGTYDYYCIPHKTLGMVGRIVVGEPSGLEGDPPDGAVPSEQRIVDEGSVSFEAFQGE